MGWDCLTVGLLLLLLLRLFVGLFWLHHIKSLANVTFVVRLLFLLCSVVTMVTKLFTLGQKRLKVIAGVRHKGSMYIL
jgi:hypothetical protein